MVVSGGWVGSGAYGARIGSNIHGTYNKHLLIIQAVVAHHWWGILKVYQTTDGDVIYVFSMNGNIGHGRKKTTTTNSTSCRIAFLLYACVCDSPSHTHACAQYRQWIISRYQYDK